MYCIFSGFRQIFKTPEKSISRTNIFTNLLGKNFFQPERFLNETNDGDWELQSFTKYLRLTLFTKFSFSQEDWALGYRSMNFWDSKILDLFLFSCGHSGPPIGENIMKMVVGNEYSVRRLLFLWIKNQFENIGSKKIHAKNTVEKKWMILRDFTFAFWKFELRHAILSSIVFQKYLQAASETVRQDPFEICWHTYV